MFKTLRNLLVVVIFISLVSLIPTHIYGISEGSENLDGVLVNISNQSGEPLEGVKVFLKFSGIPKAFQVVHKTDDDGNAAFKMPNGKGLLKLWKDGFVPRVYEFYKDSETDLSFRMYDHHPMSEIAHYIEAFKTCIVHVKEVSQAGGHHAIPDATVLHIYETKLIPYAGFYAVEEITDSNGEVVMNVPVRPGDDSITIWAYKNGYVPVRTPYVCRGDGSSPPKKIILTPILE